MQVFVYLEREDCRHQKLTLEPSIKPVLPVASVFYSVMQKVPCILVDCSPVEAVDWKGLFTFTGGEMEVGYELEGK